jgi:hypothetical protein
MIMLCASDLYAKKAEESKYAFAHQMEKVVAGIAVVLILVFVVRRLSK